MMCTLFLGANAENPICIGHPSRVSVFKSPIRVMVFKPLIRVSGPWGGPARVVRATDISPGRRCTAGSGPPGPRPDNPPRTGGNMASGALAASVSAAAARVTARAAPAGKLLGRVGDLLLQRRLTPWMLLTASDMHTSDTESVVARASSLTRIAAVASGSKLSPAAFHRDPLADATGNGPMSSGEASHVPSHVPPATGKRGDERPATRRERRRLTATVSDLPLCPCSPPPPHRALHDVSVCARTLAHPLLLAARGPLRTARCLRPVGVQPALSLLLSLPNPHRLLLGAHGSVVVTSGWGEPPPPG